MRAVALALGFCALAVGTSPADEPTAENDLNVLLGKGDQYSRWELQLPKGGKDLLVKSVVLTFYKPAPGKSHVVLVTAEGGDGKASGGFRYRLEVNGGQRFLTGTKGSVLGGEDVKIPYTLDGDSLKLGEAQANLLAIGKFSLKGKWKRIEDK